MYFKVEYFKANAINSSIYPKHISYLKFINPKFLKVVNRYHDKQLILFI